MAQKVWTSQDDWETWDWTDGDTTSSPGDVQISAGNTQAIGVSPVYEAADWAEGYWRVFRVLGSRPAGTIYYIRYRTGATQAACESADWSDYINGVDDSGTIVFDLRTHTLNNPLFDEGPYIQFEIRMESD